MTPAQLTAWRERMGYSKTQAAAALGCSRNSIGAWESGAPIPLSVELACNWLTVSATLPKTLRAVLDEIEGAME